ncbi:MAG: LysR family transcriptional regulator, partial [Gammaproteobacteria bacterium]|nr:LysR family transcriptional regulator [Gammaproteobacteria bacterium]
MDNYRLYIKIVEQGSFSKAAERLGITQPTVSKQIDRLEEKL